MRRDANPSSWSSYSFLFDYKDDSNFDSLELHHWGFTGGNAPNAQLTINDHTYFGSDYDPGDHTDANMPLVAGTDVAWFRVQNDGSTVKVWSINSATTPSESDWTAIAASPCFSGTDIFSYTGGQLGFVSALSDGQAYSCNFDDITVKSWNGSSWVTELEEHFTTDGSGYCNDTLCYDHNGNLTYDGLQSYTYDAWNKLKTTSHAYRAFTADGGDGNVHSGQVFSTVSYDAAGRRISKLINNTGDLDGDFEYYYSGNSVIEEQDGSADVLKQHIWGLEYIDELVQEGINSDPTGQSTCDTFYYAMQDANYNVLGLTDSSGNLVERYEYTAYGQRQVFYSPGSNDPGCFAPTPMSRRVITSGSVTMAYGLCEFGHQGLMHDDETGLVYNRHRMLHPTLGRFMQSDPLGYVDGMNDYLALGDNPTYWTDPNGMDDAPATVEIQQGTWKLISNHDGIAIWQRVDHITEKIYFESATGHPETDKVIQKTLKVLEASKVGGATSELANAILNCISIGQLTWNWMFTNKWDRTLTYTEQYICKNGVKVWEKVGDTGVSNGPVTSTVGDSDKNTAYGMSPVLPSEKEEQDTMQEALKSVTEKLQEAVK